MAWGEQYKQRALELKLLYDYKTVWKKLSEEFGDIDHPNERTLREWKREASKQAKKKDNSATNIAVARSKHFDNLAQIARALLGDIDYIDERQPKGDQWDIFKHLVMDRSGSGLGMTKDMLAKTLDDVFDNVEMQFETTQISYFISHLETELNDIKSQGIRNVIKENPIDYFNAMRRLADSKLFRGTCKLCKDW